jgi:hypothetical protein
MLCLAAMASSSVKTRSLWSSSWPCWLRSRKRGGSTQKANVSGSTALRLV